MSPPRVIVIGSGLGGASATLAMAHAGLPVTLLEKNPRLGGSCSFYEKQGYTLDVGTHMFTRGDRGPLGDLLRRVGAPGAIQFKRTRDIAELRVSSRGSMLDPIAVPASLSRMPKFAWEVCRAMGLGPVEAMKAGHLFATIGMLGDAEIAALDDVTVEDFLEPFGLHQAVNGLFGFLLGLYFVVPYWEASAGEAIWAFQKMIRDNSLSYPMGGSRAVPGTFIELARQHGAQVRVDAGVEKILVSDRVRGVRLTTGEEIPAEVVISTSSVRSTVLHLVGREHVPEDYANAAQDVRGSAIAVQAKVALSRPLVSAGALVGGVGEEDDLFTMTPDRLKQLFFDVNDGRVPKVVPFYCPIPTNFDASLAPPGHQLLTACAVAPTTDIRLHDPAKKWEDAMMNALRAVVPGLDEHTVFADRFTTRWIESWIGKEFGPAISTAQVPGQVGTSRPSVATPVSGLYIAGCGAGARGVGTELACASGMQAADAVLAREGRSGWRRRAPRRERLVGAVTTSIGRALLS
ncbi:MAG: NAD(P)/FAD-dependent oxidoreductase [Proteobacteria bacterium]|nr:NAD(P)/FAD-dependent oxidoreductase [Pseudomonadota bacterium]MCP4916376.1 NAD(P)/FAD-dependent oxidoreductase [Pseudomonadota bacterium]